MVAVVSPAKVEGAREGRKAAASTATDMAGPLDFTTGRVIVGGDVAGIAEAEIAGETPLAAGAGD